MVAKLEAFQQYKVLYWIWNQILSCIHVFHLWLGHPEDCFMDKNQRLYAYTIIHKLYIIIGNLQIQKSLQTIYICRELQRIELFTEDHAFRPSGIWHLPHPLQSVSCMIFCISFLIFLYDASRAY
jgi:hypothetical protein